MPLTAKGNEVMNAMKQEYGSKRGEEVFYASKNAGTVTGVDAVKMAMNQRDPIRDGAAVAPQSVFYGKDNK